MTCVPSEDSDQPGHPPSLIRVFAVHFVGSLGHTASSCGQWRLWSDWVNTQADMSLRWADKSFCSFCHVVAHFIIMTSQYCHRERHCTTLPKHCSKFCQSKSTHFVPFLGQHKLGLLSCDSTFRSLPQTWHPLDKTHLFLTISFSYFSSKKRAVDIHKNDPC